MATALREKGPFEGRVGGGCLCGRVRYAVRITDDSAYLCHCRMCQRAVGHVSAALKQVLVADVEWLGTPPDRFRSSPFAQRGFCGSCGTSLTYEGDDCDDLDLAVGSFDNPARFRPVAHYGVESRHDAWLDTRALPAKRTDENERIAGKWKDSLGYVP
jgi:hypothetical protein